jgi:type IX secretion system PorP/SprF family membrane protein
MQYKTYLVFIIALSLYSNATFAQDPLFNQNDNVQSYNNPAFIGTCESASFDLSYRNQWPQLSSNYLTTILSANQYLGKGNGVSILYTNDDAAKTIVTNRIGAGYSKQFTIKDNHHFSIGVQAIYFHKALDLSGLTFGDQIDPRYGFVYPTAQQISGTSQGVDFNTGVLYHSKYIFAGLAAQHLFEPNEGFASNSNLPRKYSLQLGGKINITDITLLPYIQANKQGTFNSVITSLKTRYKSIEIDLGYAINNGPTGGAGLKFDHWNLGYNYGYSSSLSSNVTVSTHEIRIGFQPSLFNKTNDTYFDF